MKLNQRYVELLVKYGHQIQNGATPKQIEAFINLNLSKYSSEVYNKPQDGGLLKGNE